MDNILTAILGDIECVYGPCAPRTYSELERRYRRQPYLQLVQELERHFQVADTTDLNCDVALHLGINDTTGGRWLLALSLVGKYALFWRFPYDQSAGRLIVETCRNLSMSEWYILDLLHQHGLIALDQETLATPIAISLPEIAIEDVHVYQLLFYQLEGFPWDVQSTE